jgi:RimJ/RimL family protein N-acetyltransferase
MLIKGKNVTLRAIETTDLPQLQVWANDPDIQYNLGSWHFPASMRDIERWAGTFRNDSTAQRFIIDTAAHGAIGFANLVDINWKDRNATHGILLGAPWRHQGYGVDTVTAIMRYAFEELGLARLDTTFIEHNQASYKLFTGKCGWVEEGRQKNAYFRQGRYWTKILAGITHEDYLKFRATVRLPAAE